MPGGHPSHRGVAHKSFSPPQPHPTAKPTYGSAGQPVRLYARGVFVGYKRGFRNTYHHTSLLKIENVNDKDDTDFYLGKRVSYIYKAKKNSKACNQPNTGFRVIWGKVMRSHGNNGLVRAKFRRNLPAKAMGSPVRIMLYPSRV